MKLIIFFSLITVFLNNSSPKVKQNANEPRWIVLVLNSDVDYPHQVMEKNFWAEKEMIDTIDIRGRNISRFISNSIQSLRDTVVSRVDSIGFDHAFAFVRFSLPQKIDTVYSNPTMSLFKKKGLFFVNPDGFLKKTLQNLLLF